MDAGGIMYANGGGDMMMNGTSPEMSQAQTVLNWNPNQLDIKTKSVEKTLEPLVMQVCNILGQYAVDQHGITSLLFSLNTV